MHSQCTVFILCVSNSIRTQAQPENTSPRAEAIVYEEIGEVVKETFMFTRNALYGVTVPTGLEGGQEGVNTSQARSHEYEYVDGPLSTGRREEVSSAGEAYQMEECSAYGANN